jgi:hypothetical protein
MGMMHLDDPFQFGQTVFCLFFTIGARFIPIIPVSKEKGEKEEIL